MEGVDLMGHLLRNRIIFIGGRINDEVRDWQRCVRQLRGTGFCIASQNERLLLLSSTGGDQGRGEHAGPANTGQHGRHKAVYQLPRYAFCWFHMCWPDLTCLCWSPGERMRAAGGQAYSVMAILDAMDAIKPNISTIAFGLCASTATLLLVSCSRRTR